LLRWLFCFGLLLWRGILAFFCASRALGYFENRKVTKRFLPASDMAVATL